MHLRPGDGIRVTSTTTPASERHSWLWRRDREVGTTPDRSLSLSRLARSAPGGGGCSCLAEVRGRPSTCFVARSRACPARARSPSPSYRLARGPPAWWIACRKGPESALIDDVLCQRRFVQHRRLEVDLGCGSCHGHPAFLSRLSSPAVSAVAASRESSMAMRAGTDRSCAVRGDVA